MNLYEYKEFVWFRGYLYFFIILDIILGLAIPIGLMMYLKKKFQLSIMPFLVGCTTMVLFALYGGLMAGLFEECGRFITMKSLRKIESIGINGKDIVDIRGE